MYHTMTRHPRGNMFIKEGQKIGRTFITEFIMFFLIVFFIVPVTYMNQIFGAR